MLFLYRENLAWKAVIFPSFLWKMGSGDAKILHRPRRGSFDRYSKEWGSHSLKLIILVRNNYLTIYRFYGNLFKIKK